MWVIWKPILSPTGSVVGKRQTGARAEILGDPRRRTWEWDQQDESLEAFEKRVEAEARGFAPDDERLIC